MITQDRKTAPNVASSDFEMSRPPTKAARQRQQQHKSMEGDGTARQTRAVDTLKVNQEDAANGPEQPQSMRYLHTNLLLVECKSMRRPWLGAVEGRRWTQFVVVKRVVSQRLCRNGDMSLLTRTHRRESPRSFFWSWQVGRF